MVIRKKSRIEQWLSFNQYRKRFGAGAVLDKSESIDFGALKQQLVEGDECIYNLGASRDIQQHLSNLRTEFAGRSELLYHHARMIVLIRRDYKVRQNFKEFEFLWEQEMEYLLREMNLRWLVSAADTFADHAKEPLVRALTLNVSILFNTIKMQETERFLQESEHSKDSTERQAILQNGRTDLFDGTAAFVVGTDDTLRNMRWRIDEVTELHPVGKILQEVFMRLQNEDTVYGRFRKRHTKTKTAWW